MVGVDDLMTWLRTQLDDTERIANAAASCTRTGGDHPVWIQGEPDYIDGEGDVIVPQIDAPGVVNDAGDTVVYGEGREPELDTHIALHDPDAVLREVKATRLVLELHDQGGQRWVGFPRADRQENYCVHDQLTAPCPTVRLLALPYAERAGYRDEWKP